MARKHYCSRLCAVFLLFALLFTLIATPLSAAEDDVSSMTVAEYVAQIDLALKEALASKASALETAGDTESAAYLRGFTFHPFRIAIVDIGYSQHYVKTHVGAADVADEMVAILADSFYLDKLTTPELVTDALVLCYVRATDDVYASYANEETYVAPGDEETEYGGIGVTVELLPDGYAKVIEVAHGSPAEAAGLKLGDILIAVEGEDFAQLGYDNAVNKIRGEEDTAVTVTVKRGEASLDFTMTRKKMTVRTVSYRVMTESEEKIGYVRVTKFDGTTFPQFVEAVEALENEGVESFVFDVRQNPGGRLDVIVAILDYILPDGTGSPIVRLKYKYGTDKITSITDYFYDELVEEYGHELAMLYSEMLVERYGYTPAVNHVIDKKMTVLCDGYTVSAAELFTSCLKDFGVAEVFGDTTYGKGMGQREIPIPYSYTGEDLNKDDPMACIRISAFYYSPPVSENYEGVGVLPHHRVSLPDELASTSITELTFETDLALQAAVAFIESGAPITEGKVDLTPDPEPDEGEGDASKPSDKPTDKPVNKPTDNPSDTPSDPTDEPAHSQGYVIAFWIAFGVLTCAALVLLAAGLYMRYQKQREEDAAAEKAAALLSDEEGPDGASDFDDANDFE